MTRRVVITGASNGIGAALAPLFARGNCLVLTWHDDAAAIERVRMACIEAGAESVLTERVALDDTISIARLCDSIGAEPIDTMILNAGILVKGRFEDMSAVDIVRQVQVNLVAPQLIVRALIGRLCGQVVFVGSDVATQAVPGMAPYCSTKFGLRGFAQALALDMTQLAVLLVNPDRTATRMNDGEGRDVHDVAAAMHRAIVAPHGCGYREVDLWRLTEGR